MQSQLEGYSLRPKGSTDPKAQGSHRGEQTSEEHLAAKGMADSIHQANPRCTVQITYNKKW